MQIFLNNNLKKKLLAYVFTHVDKDFYVRELAGFIGEDPGNLSRLLRKLEADGLFRSVVRGRAKFYSLRKEYPLFQELKRMIIKTEGVVGRLKDVVDKFDGVLLAFIHGSYAREEEKRSSDVDLVVVGELLRARFTKEIRALEAKFGREINFSSYTLEEFEREAKKAGSFLGVVVKEKIIVLKGVL